LFFYLRALLIVKTFLTQTVLSHLHPACLLNHPLFLNATRPRGALLGQSSLARGFLLARRRQGPRIIPTLEAILLAETVLGALLWPGSLRLLPRALRLLLPRALLLLLLLLPHRLPHLCKEKRQRRIRVVDGIVRGRERGPTRRGGECNG
jgi:hypothetical protein